MSKYNTFNPGRTVYSVPLNPFFVCYDCAWDKTVKDAVAGLSGPSGPGLEA